VPFDPAPHRSFLRSGRWQMCRGVNVGGGLNPPTFPPQQPWRMKIARPRPVGGGSPGPWGRGNSFGVNCPTTWWPKVVNLRCRVPSAGPWAGTAAVDWGPDQQVRSMPPGPRVSAPRSPGAPWISRRGWACAWRSRSCAPRTACGRRTARWNRNWSATMVALQRVYLRAGKVAWSMCPGRVDSGPRAQVRGVLGGIAKEPHPIIRPGRAGGGRGALGTLVGLQGPLDGWSRVCTPAPPRPLASMVQVGVAPSARVSSMVRGFAAYRAAPAPTSLPPRRLLGCPQRPRPGPPVPAVKPAGSSFHKAVMFIPRNHMLLFVVTCREMFPPPLIRITAGRLKYKKKAFLFSGGPRC